METSTIYFSEVRAMLKRTWLAYERATFETGVNFDAERNSIKELFLKMNVLMDVKDVDNT